MARSFRMDRLQFIDNHFSFAKRTFLDANVALSNEEEFEDFYNNYWVDNIDIWEKKDFQDWVNSQF